MVKNLPANTGEIRYSYLIPGAGKSPERGHGNSLQYFCLESPMDRGAWWAEVFGVTRVEHDSVTKQQWEKTVSSVHSLVTPNVWVSPHRAIL